jgi:hypothetical protein
MVLLNLRAHSGHVQAIRCDIKRVEKSRDAQNEPISMGKMYYLIADVQ